MQKERKRKRKGRNRIVMNYGFSSLYLQPNQPRTALSYGIDGKRKEKKKEKSLKSQPKHMQ